MMSSHVKCSKIFSETFDYEDKQWAVQFCPRPPSPQIDTNLVSGFVVHNKVYIEINNQSTEDGTTPRRQNTRTFKNLSRNLQRIYLSRYILRILYLSRYQLRVHLSRYLLRIYLSTVSIYNIHHRYLLRPTCFSGFQRHEASAEDNP